MIDSDLVFGHVLRLTDRVGIFEHASGVDPRREHGYCLDDVARALLVVVREPSPSPALVDLEQIYMRFIEDAQAPDGRFRNRLDVQCRWRDRPSLDDCWGRALWALGTAAARKPDERLGEAARELFARSARCRSPHPRALAFAALGAAEILTLWPGDRGAQRLLAAASSRIGRPSAHGRWLWPEPRLTYANAALPDALIATGEHLDDGVALADGLAMLDWLVEVETAGDHLSVTPVGGWALGEPRPAFDQQPIEAASLADACVRAWRVTGDERWLDALGRAVSWFLGNNDLRTVMIDPASGGGYDGITPAGANTNQGAESTLAMLATMQHARALAVS